MGTTRTLSGYLAQNGLKTAAAAAPATAASAAAAAPAATPTPAKTTAAKAPAKVAGAAAPAKAAADQTATAGSANQATTEAAGGHKVPEKVTQAPAQDTGKTAAQLFLESKGVIVADPKMAEAMVEGAQKTAEAQKVAYLEKRAEEERLRGELIGEGILRFNTTLKLAARELTIDEAASIAPICGGDINAMVKRAEQLQAVMSHPALVGGLLGSAARTDVSAVTQVADRNDNTSTTRDIEAIEGTRKATSGMDEKTLRFVDVWTLPNSPGLNHGQAVDQGKSLNG